MRLLFLAASPRARSRSRKLVRRMFDAACRRHDEHELDFLDLREEAPEAFRGFDEDYTDATRAVVRRVATADALVVGSPVFNGSYSAALKNLFEHVDYKALVDRVAGVVLVGGSEASFLQARSHFEQLMAYYQVYVVPHPVFATEGEVDQGIPEDVEARLDRLVDAVVRTRLGLLAEGVGAREARAPAR